MTRSKLRRIGIFMSAICLMALGAAPAQAAPEWLILNSAKEVKTAAELPAELLSELDIPGKLFTRVASTLVSVGCEEIDLNGMNLEGEGKLTSGSTAVFLECNVYDAAEVGEPVLEGCKPKTFMEPYGIIKSNALKGQLQATGEVSIELAGVGHELARLELEPGCIVPSPIPVNGVLWIKDSEGAAAKHLKNHSVEESKANGKTLWVGKNTEEHLATELRGSALVALSGNHLFLQWGALFP